MNRLGTFKRILRTYFQYKIGKPKPFIAVFNTTQKCNLSCDYCAIKSNCSEDKELQETLTDSSKVELKTEDVKLIIEKINSLGVSYFNFSGGEPLLRDDIEELGSYAKSLGMSTSLYTNGLLLSDKDIKNLSQSFHTIMISLPHSQKGVFRTQKEIKVIKKNINQLKKENTSKVGISFVITKYNFEEIEEIADYAKKNVDFIFYNPVHYAPDFLPKRIKAKEIKRRVLEIKKSNRNLVSNSVNYIKKFEDYFNGEKIDIKCNAFSLYLSILSNGDLQGCCQPFSVGNILEEEPEKLLEEGLKRKGQLLKTCDRKKMMGGCGQASFLFEKSILGSLPAAVNLLNKSLFS